MSSTIVVLGSRSPRRFDLLSTIVSPERIEVIPPLLGHEAGFDGLDARDEIQTRQLEISRTKLNDVRKQVRERGLENVVIVTADTSIVVADPSGNHAVLEQPPRDDSWKETVRQWFRTYYFGQSHIAATALCVAHTDGTCIERLVETTVEFGSDGERWLDLYIETGEPLGKAGGYGIQGAGGLFVSRLQGSLTNVVGLPLSELLEIFEELGVEYC